MRIEFMANAILYDVRDPKFSWGRSDPIVVTDRHTLAAHGDLTCDEPLLAYLADGSDTAALADILAGGLMRFRFLDAGAGRYVVTTEYIASRQLTTEEIDQLREYTYGQWMDGVGSGFRQEYAERTGYWPEVEEFVEPTVAITG